MRDLAIQAGRLFSELDPSGEALSPCGRFLGSASAGEGEVAGADERLSGLRVPFLPPPLAPSFTTLVPILGTSGGFLAVILLPFVFVTPTFFDVTFVLVVTTFATVPTGDGTLKIALIGHCFPILSVLLSLQLQQTTTAMVTVRGMTGSPLVIDRLRVEEWGCTGFRFNLTHGTQVILPFTTTLVGVSGIFRPFLFATFRGRGGTSAQVSLEEFFHMGVILPVEGQFDRQVHKVILREGPTFPL